MKNKGSHVRVSGGIDIDNPRISRKQSKTDLEITDISGRFRTFRVNNKPQAGWEICFREKGKNRERTVRFHRSLHIGRKDAAMKGRNDFLGISSDPKISLNQCYIYEEEGELRIRDRHSENGTLMDGIRVREGVPLRNHCTLIMGKSVFSVEYRRR